MHVVVDMHKVALKLLQPAIRPPIQQYKGKIGVRSHVHIGLLKVRHVVLRTLCLWTTITRDSSLQFRLLLRLHLGLGLRLCLCSRLRLILTGTGTGSRCIF